MLPAASSPISFVIRLFGGRIEDKIESLIKNKLRNGMECLSELDIVKWIK